MFGINQCFGKHCSISTLKMANAMFARTLVKTKIQHGLPESHTELQSQKPMGK
jgi:hypothetical protein